MDKSKNPFKTANEGSLLEMVLMKAPDSFTRSKRLIDNAEGLWRVHDGLYDLNDFIDKHPGGRFWLESTEGTDITEAFESHHIVSTTPEELLKKYYVRKAKLPRYSSFTFKEDGFYKTVKRNVREVLKTIPKEDKKISNLYTDCLVIIAFVFAALASFLWNFKLAVLSGIFAGVTICATHNYVHRRDNFRMLYSDLFMLFSRDYRSVHVLSHHFYPNSITDTQVYFTEPFVVHFPQKKSFTLKYLSWIYTPLLFWPSAFQVASLLSVVANIHYKTNYLFDIKHLVILLLPLTVKYFGNLSLIATLGLWQFIVSVGSFTFCVLAFTNSHIHPDTFMEGDTPRIKEESDWGLNQLDTIADRHEVTGNKFLVLVSFGDHALHHLFPTLDSSQLHHLYPVVTETMKQFNVHIRMMSQLDMFLGYFRQVARENSNPVSPSVWKRVF